MQRRRDNKYHRAAWYLSKCSWSKKSLARTKDRHFCSINFHSARTVLSREYTIAIHLIPHMTVNSRFGFVHFPDFRILIYGKIPVNLLFRAVSRATRTFERLPLFLFLARYIIRPRRIICSAYRLGAMRQSRGIFIIAGKDGGMGCRKNIVNPGTSPITTAARAYLSFR